MWWVFFTFFLTCIAFKHAIVRHHLTVCTIQSCFRIVHLNEPYILLLYALLPMPNIVKHRGCIVDSISHFCHFFFRCHVYREPINCCVGPSYTFCSGSDNLNPLIAYACVRVCVRVYTNHRTFELFCARFSCWSDVEHSNPGDVKSKKFLPDKIRKCAMKDKCHELSRIVANVALVL